MGEALGSARNVLWAHRVTLKAMPLPPLLMDDVLYVPDAGVRTDLETGLDLDLDLLYGPNPTDYPRTSANVGA